MENIEKYLMRPLEYQQAGLKELITFLPENIRMAEIGCYMGESSRIFLDSGKVRQIICVDPWENGYDPTDEASFRCDMREIEKYFDEHMIPYDGKFRKLKGRSVDAAVFAPLTEPYDFVYIDACHTYEAVKNDIEMWKVCIKAGGLIGGHDYGQADINRAIAETLGAPDRTFQDGSWLKWL